MKNRDIWESYVDYTRQASSNVRWLTGMLLASILYKIEDISLSLLYLIGLLFAVLIVDILQYGSSALLLKQWTEREEEKNLEEHDSIDKNKDGEDLEYKKPRDIDKFAFLCWTLKIVFLLIAIILFLWILSGANINQ